MGGVSIRGLYKLAIFLLFIILVAEVSAVDVQAQKKASVTGTVVDENGSPISGANVTLLAFDHRSFVMRVKTDSSGRFYASVNKEGSYLIYVTYDNKKRLGWTMFPRDGTLGYPQIPYLHVNSFSRKAHPYIWMEKSDTSRQIKWLLAISLLF